MKASILATAFAAILPNISLAQDSAAPENEDIFEGCFPVLTSSLSGVFCAVDPNASPSITITPEEMIAETPGTLFDMNGLPTAPCSSVERLTKDGEIFNSIICGEVPFYRPEKVEPVKPTWPTPEIGA
jgi:hypothetical protein